MLPKFAGNVRIFREKTSGGIVIFLRKLRQIAVGAKTRCSLLSPVMKQNSRQGSE